MSGLERLGLLKVPGEVLGLGNTGFTEWEMLITPPQAFASTTFQAGKPIYPPILDDPRLDCSAGGMGGKGLYVWLVRSDAGQLRFVHVGISERGASSVARRTRVHLKGQLLATDRLHRVQWTSAEDPFGSLGPDLRRSPEAQVVAREFLQRLQILFLLPMHVEGKEIRRFEGVLSHAASHLLDVEERHGDKGWETTNTLSKNSRWEISKDERDRDQAAERVARMFREHGVAMLPDRRRRAG